MWISVDIRQIGNHLSILHDELKETTVLMEELSIMCQYGEASDQYIKLLQRVRNIDESIRRRIALLEDMSDKFRNTKSSVEDILDDSLKILGHFED